MKLNMKKVFLVILVLVLIILGIWAGISLTNTDNKPESENNKNSNKITDVTDNEVEKDNVGNALENTIETSSNSVSNNTLDITTNNIDNNTTTNSNKDVTTSEQPKSDLNSYLEKFSLICYLDSRTKELEKEVKRNEDYIDIAMLFAKEHNINGEEVNGKRAVSKEVVHKIISETRGRSTPETLEIAEVLYKYDEASNQYYFNQDDERIAHIFDIIEKTEENGIINLKYTCCFPSKAQISNNNFSGLGKYVITMELRENTNYEYSKYRIQNYQFVIE